MSKSYLQGIEDQLRVIKHVHQMLFFKATAAICSLSLLGGALAYLISPEELALTQAAVVAALCFALSLHRFGRKRPAMQDVSEDIISTLFEAPPEVLEGEAIKTVCLTLLRDGRLTVAHVEEFLAFESQAIALRTASVAIPAVALE